MNGYFANLLDRTFAAGPMIEPLPLSTYQEGVSLSGRSEILDDMAPVEKLADFQLITPEEPAAQISTSLREAGTAEERGVTSRRPVEDSAEPFPIQEKTALPHDTESVPSKGTTRISFIPVPAEHELPSQKKVDSVARNSSESRPNSAPFSAMKSDRVYSPRLVVPASALREKESAGRRHALEPTPRMVKVTIGRIEVRASLSAAPAPSRRQTATPGKLSLDDYLKSRNGGAR